MTIHTVSSLRATHRRLAERVGRIEMAESVLAEMQAGAALHLQYTRSGPCWVLSNGRQISDGIAKLVIASSSVVGVGDALFDGVASQTFRWWRETSGMTVVSSLVRKLGGPAVVARACGSFITGDAVTAWARALGFHGDGALWLPQWLMHAASN